MNALLRKTVAVAMIGSAPLLVPRGSAADEAAQEGFAGSWITWWDQGGALSPCSRVDVVPESEELLDGMWAAPGLNGVLHGAVAQQSEGLKWQGEWRDAEGGTGGFRFILAPDGRRFEGAYTLEEGDEERLWNGVRYVQGDIPEAPCVFAG
jgi:hypothetical protein